MEGLEHKTDPCPPQPRPRSLVQRGEHGAADGDTAFIGVVQPRQDVQQGRFADARFADDRDQFACRHLKIEVAEQPAVARNRLAELAYIQNGPGPDHACVVADDRPACKGAGVQETQNRP